MGFDLGNIKDEDFNSILGGEVDSTPSVVEEAFKTDPAAAAKIKGLSRDLGAPTFAIESDVPGMERKQRVSAIDFEALKQNSPVTHSYLGEYDKAVLIQDDITPMSVFENTLISLRNAVTPPEAVTDFSISDTFSGIGKSIALSYREQARGGMLHELETGARRIEDLIPSTAMPMGMEFQAAEMSRELASRMGITTDEDLVQAQTRASETLITEIKDLAEQRKELTPDDLSILEQGVRGGIESLGQMAPGFVAMIATGGKAFPLLTSMGAQTYAGSYADARAEGLDSTTAQWKSLIDASIEVGTEVLPTGTLSKMLTGGAKSDLTKSALKFMVQEMGTEQLATLGQSLNDYAFGLDEQLQNATSVEEMVQIQLQRQAVTAISTVVAGGAQTGVVASINKAISMTNVNQSQMEATVASEQDTLDTIAKNAEQMKVRTNDVETFRQFVQDADADNNTNVFINAQAVKDYIATQDDPTLAKLSEQVNEAASLDGDIVISVADFASDIVGTPHYDALRQYMTLSAESVSPAQLQESQEATKRYIDQYLVKTAEENVSQYVEAQEIFQSVKAQLIDSGAYSATNADYMAKVVPAWATVYAKENGISVQEAFDRSGLTIEGPQTGEASRIATEEALLTQPLPSRMDIFQAVIGIEGTPESLAATIAENIDNHPNLYRPNDYEALPVIKDMVDEESSALAEAMATNGGTDFVAAYTSVPTKLAYLWDDKGNLYQVLRGNYRPVDSDRAADLSTNMLDVVFRDIENQDPEVQRQQQIDKIKNTEESRRQRRLDEVPTVAPNFNVALQELADWSENFQEFSKVLSPSMFDISDRNRTRLGRARIALPEDRAEYTNAGDGDVTIYRAMPEGQEIEAGDWVSMNREYAAGHETNVEDSAAVTTEVEVPGSDVWWYGADESEWVYIPEGTWGEYQTLKEVWDDLTGGNKPDAYPRPWEQVSEPLLAQARPQQTGPQEARGYYDPANAVIRMTESADLSTFLHEFAHFMYEMELKTGSDRMQSIHNWFKRNAADVAEEGGVTEEQVVSYLDNGTTGDTNIDAAIRRAVHEQFARGFETYLMEGKAPSIELRNAFRKFASWLVDIYKSIKGDLKVNLDAEMRQVFDRMLATEEQIAMAAARARVEPLFTDAAQAGMTAAEYAAYQKKQQGVTEKAQESLRDKLMAELTRQKQQWWDQEKADLIDEEMVTLRTERVYRAREVLTDPTGDIKLDRAELKERYAVQRTDKRGITSTIVPDALKGMHKPSSDAVSLDEAAAILGYTSGDQMVEELMDAPKLKDKAEENAQQRMLAEHGDIMNDGTIQAEADAALMNEERGKLLLSELKTLRRGTSQATLERQALKDMAVEVIGKLSYQQIHPAKYRKAEILAAQDAVRLLATGDRAGAANAKSRQVMNFYLGMEATKARQGIEDIVDRTSRYRKKAVQVEIIKAENGYWDQMVKILQRFEFRKSASLKTVAEQNEAIGEWAIGRNVDHGDGLVLTPEVLNELYTQHWKQVPYSVLQGVNDSLKNIEHVARYGNKIRTASEEVDFKKFVAAWTDHIASKGKRYKTSSEKSRLEDAQKASLSKVARKWASQLTKIPFMASWLDGGERAGLSHEVIMQPFTDALDAKFKLMDSVAKPILDLIKNRSKEDVKRHSRKIFIPEINDTLEGHQILAVALNVGNQSNLYKMLVGEGWANPDVEGDVSMDNPKLKAILAHMTKSDWQLVQQTWDQMEMLYPMLADVYKKSTGIVPPKVEATPLSIVVDGETLELQGGYYPVKYSFERSGQAKKNKQKMEAETESMFNASNSVHASVSSGATNQRTGYTGPIKLSLDTIPEHFEETIHYITHHEAVRQMNKLINNQQVEDAITASLGEEKFDLLKPWLNDIAKDGRNQPAKGYVDEIFGKLRTGTTLAVMGFSATTGIMQTFGLFTTAAEIGVGPTLKGIYNTVGKAWYMKHVRKMLGSPADMQTGWEFVSERSKVMNHRMTTMDREIRNALKDLSNKTGLLAAVQEASMKHIALMQTYMVDLPTWMAMYDKTLSETGDESKAIKAADWAVENLQGSGAIKDTAALLRNQSKVHSTFTMFMTFFSSLGNLGSDLRYGNYSATSIAAKLMFLYAIPVLTEMLMRGEFGDDDEPDEMLSNYLTQLALYPVSSLPFIRDVASGLGSDYSYNSSPVASMLEKGIGAYKQIGERTFTDDEITRGAWKNASKLTAAAAGVPGINQWWRSFEHLEQVVQEGEEFTVSELVFGPDRDK